MPCPAHHGRHHSAPEERRSSMAGHVPTPAQVKAAATVTGMIRSVQEHDLALLSAVKDNAVSAAEAIARLERSPQWVWVAMEPESKLLLSTWTEILVCFEYGSPGGIAWDGSEKMCKNICPGT